MKHDDFEISQYLKMRGKEFSNEIAKIYFNYSPKRESLLYYQQITHFFCPVCGNDIVKQDCVKELCSAKKVDVKDYTTYLNNLRKIVRNTFLFN